MPTPTLAPIQIYKHIWLSIEIRTDLNIFFAIKPVEKNNYVGSIMRGLLKQFKNIWTY